VYLKGMPRRPCAAASMAAFCGAGGCLRGKEEGVAFEDCGQWSSPTHLLFRAEILCLVGAWRGVARGRSRGSLHKALCTSGSNAVVCALLYNDTWTVRRGLLPAAPWRRTPGVDAGRA